MGADAAIAEATGKKTPGRDASGRFAGAANEADKANRAEGEKPSEPFRLKRKLKVPGEEFEVDLDEDGVVRQLQRLRLLEKQGKTLGEAQRLVKLFRSNPEAALEAMGLDVEGLARKRLAEKARLGAMSPEETEAHQAKSELERIKAEHQRLIQEREAERREALDARTRQEWADNFRAALAEAGEEESGQAIGEMAAIQMAALTQDGLELTPKQAAMEYRRREEARLERRLSAHTKAFSEGKVGPEKFLGSIPKDFRAAVLKASIQLAEEQGVVRARRPQQARPVEEEASRPERILSGAEVDEAIRVMRRGK